jgi:hypothetical protein
MLSRIASLAAAFALGAVAVASASVTDSGIVIRVDHGSSVVMLEDGRMYRMTSATVVLVDDRPTSLTGLRRGQRVVIEAGEPVIFREGRYIALPPASSAVTAQGLPPAAVPVAPPPSDSRITAKETTEVPAGGREKVYETIYGTVTDVDRSGKITIKTERGSFEARVAPETPREIHKGDTVVIDLTISPPGAASPR